MTTGYRKFVLFILAVALVLGFWSLQSLKLPYRVVENRSSVDLDKRESIKEAFLHGWNGYKKNCWGEDELRSQSLCKNWIGLGLTIVDSLDTLWIMDLKEEFKEAKEWVTHQMQFERSGRVSFFETTIRILGGLLSAYDLSGDSIFLEKAKLVGEKLSVAFDTKSGYALSEVNLIDGTASPYSWLPQNVVILSETGSVQLEFTYLAHHSGNEEFKRKALKVWEQLDKVNKPMGLYPVHLNYETGEFHDNFVNLGARGDSFYEYLLKLWLLEDKSNDKWKRMYDDAIESILSRLLDYSTPSHLTYFNQWDNDHLNPNMEHLVCFFGGLFALHPRSDRDLEIAKGITETCYEMYHRTETGISPEMVTFVKDRDFEIPNHMKYYILRPETVESLFVLWRKTHDQKYRDMGWSIFQSISKYCRTDIGFSGIEDVNSETPGYDNLQQSFFLAETLKYLYLLFSDDELIPLDKYVFTTEAHPLSIIRNK